MKAKNKKILITAGGTGGHLFPAQAVAEELLKEDSEVLFVAAGLHKNRYFDRERFLFEEIASRPFILKNPVKSLLAIKDLILGVSQGIKILRKFSPDAVVGFGSYYTVPILIGAKYLNIPIILHEANSIPGRANKWLGKLATIVGIHFPDTAQFFKNKAIEVGLPLREKYQLNRLEKSEALKHYGLMPNTQTLLICGGSQGAKAINELIEELIEKKLPLLKKLSLQIIHLTGNAEKTILLSSLYAQHHVRAVVKTFESDMHIAWQAADAFIGRAGAATIAESVEFEVPGILIPYPYATDGHQDKNAEFLVQRIESGIKLCERGLIPEKLGESLVTLFDLSRYSSYKDALKRYKQRTNQITLKDIILETAAKPHF